MEKEMQLESVKYSTYVLVWSALIVFTSITVTVARLHLSNYAILIAIAIATTKAALVIIYFMHLKYEPLILKTMLFLALLALTSIVMLTFSDVLYR